MVKPIYAIALERKSRFKPQSPHRLDCSMCVVQDLDCGHMQAPYHSAEREAKAA